MVRNTHLCCIYPVLGKVFVVYKPPIIYFYQSAYQQDFLQLHVDSLIVGYKVGWYFIRILARED